MFALAMIMSILLIALACAVACTADASHMWTALVGVVAVNKAFASYEPICPELANQDCFDQQFTCDRCCNTSLSMPFGESDCWAGPYFADCCGVTSMRILAAESPDAVIAWTEERMLHKPPPCPPTAQALCFDSSYFTCERCCDNQLGPEGDATCWPDMMTIGLLPLTFESCCGSTPSTEPSTSSQMSNVSRLFSPTTRKSLVQTFIASGTDKFWSHGYHRYYERYLAPYRDLANASILEIGVAAGASLKSWLDYFSLPALVQGLTYNATINGSACDLFPQHCAIVHLSEADQSDPEQLRLVIEDAKKVLGLGLREAKLWDIIIDDGSHVPAHQLTTFKHLFPRLRPGGIFIIEDVETSYFDSGMMYGYKIEAGLWSEAPASAVEKFKQLVDVISRKHFGQPAFTVFGKDVDHDVAEVRFGDGLIMIMKTPASPDWNRFPRQLYPLLSSSSKIGVARAQKMLTEETHIV